jgi:hypothetical protein
MKLGTLFRKALYKDLRSALGYYDARRIMRAIEDPEIKSLDGLSEVLAGKGMDPRQVGIVVEVAKKNGASMAGDAA